MIEEILPSCVVADEAAQDTDDALFPEEQAVVAAAVDNRRREFTTVRSCARRALARLGVPPVAILPGAGRAPIWPAGIVGSMTHCAGYRASAVARATDLSAIGIDGEEHRPLLPEVLALVATPGEREALRHLGVTAPGTCWDRLLFSAKEAVYKAWFPLTGRWLGFEDASVRFDPVAAAFAVRLLVPGPQRAGRRLTGFRGRWLVRDGLVVTAVTVPADFAADGRGGECDPRADVRHVPVLP